MRKDIKEIVKIMMKDNIKPNFAELSRKYNCDYRTIKKYYDSSPEEERETIQKPSILDPYKVMVMDKYKDGCTASSIFEFIKKKGYPGSYSVVKRFCRQYKDEQIKKATIRFETMPGLQAQVDWKESKKMISKNGEEIEINIFLIVMGYSRYKYIELTLDRNQDTVMQCLVNAFKFFGGVPKEILFDNMKTVVDHSRSDYTKAVINSTFYEFSKDMGFEALACRSFRPQTIM